MATSQQRRCNALHEDGSDCMHFTGYPSHPRCGAHHREYKDLNTRYKSLDESYHKIAGKIEGLTPSEQEVKLQLGTDLVACRYRVHQRFHSESSSGNRGHIRRILRIQSELESLKIAIDRRNHPREMAQVSVSDATSADM